MPTCKTCHGLGAVPGYLGAQPCSACVARVTPDLTEDELLDAIRIDPFDDGLVAALRAVRRRGGPGRARNRRWETALKNILAATSSDELEEVRRAAIAAWAVSVAEELGSDPIAVSVRIVDALDEEDHVDP